MISKENLGPNKCDKSILSRKLVIRSLEGCASPSLYACLHNIHVTERKRLEAETRSVPRHSLSLLGVYVCASVQGIEKDRLEAKHERQFILLKHLCTSYLH